MEKRKCLTVQVRYGRLYPALKGTSFPSRRHFGRKNERLTLHSNDELRVKEVNRGFLLGCAGLGIKDTEYVKKPPVEGGLFQTVPFLTLREKKPCLNRVPL